MFYHRQPFLPIYPRDNHNKNKDKHRNITAVHFLLQLPRISQEILFPAFEYFIASMQYTDEFTIQTRHTASDGKKPILKTKAQIVSTPAEIAHTLFVAEYALNAHFPIMIFSASSQVSIHFFENFAS